MKAKPAAKAANGSTAVNIAPGTAGLQVIIDPQTGLVVQATAAQLGELSAASKTAGGVTVQSRPLDPEIVQLPGGGEMARVPDRLMMNAIGFRDADGKLTYGCQQGNGPIVPLTAAAAAGPALQAPWEAK